MLSEQECKPTQVDAMYVPKKDNGVLGLLGRLARLHSEHQFKLVHVSVHLETVRVVPPQNHNHVSFTTLNQHNHSGDLGELGALAVPVAVVVP